MFTKIIPLSFVFLVLFILWHFDLRQKNELRTYILCQDLQTQQWLVPLSEHQYQTFKKAYSDFTSMYECAEKEYTLYHVNLIKKKSR